MTIFKKILFSLPFFGLILLSFSIFSPYYSNTLNSDHVVHILMGKYLELPNDFYYWGQDRLGSFIPLITHWFLFIFTLKSITAISIVQYTVLFFTFYFFQRFLTNYFSKILLCLVLFFPFPIMLVQVYVGHPYVGQFFIFSLILFLSRPFLNAGQSISQLRKYFIWLGICILFYVSIWISEVSFLFVAFYFASFFIIQTKLNISVSSFQLTFNFDLKESLVYTALLGLATFAGLDFIKYCKKNSYHCADYDTWFTDSKRFFNALEDFWIGFRNSFEYRIHDIYISTHNIIVILLLIAIFIFTLMKIKKGEMKLNFFLTLFFLNAVCGFFFLLFSNWVARNNYEFRYFIYSYLFFALFLIFYFDSIQSKIRIWLQAAYFIAICFYFCRTYFHEQINYGSDERNFSLKKMRDFKSLSHSGIIGNYWFSYVFGIDSEMDIVATPFEGEYVRKPSMVDSVFSREDIYIIKNSFLQNFPETLVQFGRSLKKNGLPFKIDGLEICKYKKSKFIKTYSPRELKTNSGVFKSVPSESVQEVLSSDPNKEYNKEYFSFGPFINLQPGKYKVVFAFKIANTKNNYGTVTFDVSENWGQKALVSKTVRSNDPSLENNIQTMVLDFDCPRVSNLVELRINIVGKVNLTFYNVTIEQIK